MKGYLQNLRYISSATVPDLVRQRGLGEPVRCGGSLRCRNWCGFPHERLSLA
jgi:hypothetical protein